MNEYTAKDIDRFWDKVDCSGECWEWIASIGSTGYGQFAKNNMPQKAHRVAWIITYGDIPSNLQVLHSCDNRKCVRPDHLFLGTQLDNMRDMISKGRSNHPPNLGEKHGMAKLSTQDVIAIRQLRGQKTYKAIAEEFGVATSTIGMIMTGDNWRHIK